MIDRETTSLEALSIAIRAEKEANRLYYGLLWSIASKQPRWPWIKNKAGRSRGDKVMEAIVLCANCGEEIVGTLVRRGAKTYCSQACAFEASRSKDCGGRVDVSQVTSPADRLPRPDKMLVDAQQVVEALNDDLIAELSAVEVYRSHAAAILEPDIAQGLRGILQVEEGHARELAKRIQELGGVPARAGEGPTIMGRAIGAASGLSTNAEMLKLDLAEEERAIKNYRTQIAGIMGDESTVALLRQHLKDETDHALWLRAKIGLSA